MLIAIMMDKDRLLITILLRRRRRRRMLLIAAHEAMRKEHRRRRSRWAYKPPIPYAYGHFDLDDWDDAAFKHQFR